MTKTEILTRFGIDDASRLALGRVLDKAEYTRTRDVPSHSHFLTDGEQALAQRALSAFGAGRYVLFGGYEGASRRVCVFLPDWMEELDPEDPDGPLGAVEVTPPRDSALTHRDYLGAMMGLGITREVAGDLLVTPERCQVVCLRSALHVLLTQWSEVGKYPVKVREVPLAQLEPVESGGKTFVETFQSLRFDAVAASGLNIPRTKAAGLIAGGKLLLNHLPCPKPDRLVEEGDTISGKGFGKCVVKKVGGLSKKGRVIVELERF